MCSQASHASVGTVTEHLDNKDHSYLTIMDWLGEGMPKIVVGCDSEDELFQLEEQARINYIMSYLVKDAGKTEFKEATYTCVAIGPDQDEKIDKITGHLKLL